VCTVPGMVVNGRARVLCDCVGGAGVCASTVA